MYFTCENKITVSHDDQNVIMHIIKAYNQGRLFDEFVPCPKVLGRSEHDATVQRLTVAGFIAIGKCGVGAIGAGRKKMRMMAFLYISLAPTGLR